MRARLLLLVAGPGRAVVVDGSETADPEGDAFTFDWAITERPSSSVAALVGFGQPTTQVTPDVVGRYVVTLTATDEHGAVGTADVELLPRDLGVVLTWGPSGAAACNAFSAAQCEAMTPAERAQTCCGQSDLDVHLVRPGGALGDYGQCPAACDPLFCGELDDAHVDTCRQTGTDCAFANRAPDWGAPGRVDDPRLDIDDVRGFGPEIVSLDDPEDGVYRVLVHHCADRIGEPSLATVEILVEGVSTFVTAPEPIEADEVWTAATLIRSGGSWDIVGPPGLVEQAPSGLCKVERSREEHSEVEEMLANIESMEPSASDYMERVRELKELVEHHVSEEEGEVFRRAGDVIDNDEQRELAREFHAAKEQIVFESRPGDAANDEAEGDSEPSSAQAEGAQGEIEGDVESGERERSVRGDDADIDVSRGMNDTSLEEEEEGSPDALEKGEPGARPGFFELRTKARGSSAPSARRGPCRVRR
jgi:hypothetical protein